MTKAQIEELIINDNLYLLKSKNESKFFYNIKRIKLIIKHNLTLKQYEKRKPL